MVLNKNTTDMKSVVFRGKAHRSLKLSLSTLSLLWIIVAISRAEVRQGHRDHHDRRVDDDLPHAFFEIAAIAQVSALV